MTPLANTDVQTTSRENTQVDYTKSSIKPAMQIVMLLGGFLAAAAVLYLFYRSITVSVIVGVIFAPFTVRAAKKSAVKKRMFRLREQFKDMLEAMNVSMRAGSNEVKALQSAYKDLLLVYPPETDIVREVHNMLALYDSGLPLRQIFRNFANRSGLEDVKSFASIFEAIEGKSNRANEIMRQTQKVIADKIEVEAEIETMITSTKSEQNMMFCMPIMILLVMNLMGDGFLDSLYTSLTGRITATVTIIIFVGAFLISNKITNFRV